MLPADQLGLSKPVFPGGFHHLFNLVFNFLNIKLTAESVNFSKS